MTTLDVEEFLRPEVRSEARFGDDVIGEFERGSRCDYGVTAVGDIGERASVDNRRGAFKGLYKVGLQRDSEQRRPGTCGVEIGGGNRTPVAAQGDQHVSD